MTRERLSLRDGLLFGAVTLAALALGAAALRASANLVAGLRLRPHSTGAVSCVWTGGDGAEHALPPQPSAGGRVSFRIPRGAAFFRFVFAPSDAPYHVEALSFFGLPLFSAQWLNNMVNQDTPVYIQQYVGRRDALEIAAPPGRETSLSYRRFFTLLLQFFNAAGRFSRTLVAALFLLTLGVLLAVRRRAHVPAPGRPRLSAAFLAAAQRPGLFYFLVAAAALLTLPSPVHPITGGCDPSWVWLLNRMAFDPAGIGQAFFFTYGPLGFLLVPQPVGHNVLAALLCSAGYALLYALLLTTFWRRFPDSRPAAFCLAACALMLPSSEWRWFVPVFFSVALCCHLPPSDRKRLLLFAGLAGFLVVFVSLIKFTLAIVSGLCLALALSYLALFSRRNVLPFAAAFLGAFLLAVAAARLTLFRSGEAMLDWLSVSWQVAAGYNSAMVTQASAVDLLIPLAFLASYLWLLVPLRHCTVARVAQLALLSPVIFFAFKYSITRAGAGFVRTVVYVLPCATGLLAVFADPAWRSRVLKLFAAQLAAGWAVLVCTGFFLQLPMIGASPKNLKETLFLSTSVKRAQAHSEEALNALKLPASWVSQIGTDTFSSYPVELVYAQANHLKLLPFPILQGYSAYTEALDRRGASLFERASGPEWLLCAFDTPDMRNNVIDTPSVWNAIRANYQAVTTDGKRVLFRRTDGASAWVFEPVHSQTVSPGEWVDLGASDDGAPYLSLHWRPTFWGKVIPLFWRNTHCSITLERTSGEHRRWRLIPDTARTPFAIHEVPFSDREFSAQLAGGTRPDLRVRRLRVACEAPFFFEPTLTVTRYRASLQRSKRP
jgi:hypothetical protein